MNNYNGSPELSKNLQNRLTLLLICPRPQKAVEISGHGLYNFSSVSYGTNPVAGAHEPVVHEVEGRGKNGIVCFAPTAKPMEGISHEPR